MRIKAEVQISGLVDGKMRQGIGGVCVHWSLLELMVERVIAHLENRPGIVTYESDLAHRLDDLKTVAKRTLPQCDHERISEIAGFIKKVKEERHRVVHGLWGMDASGSLISLFPRDVSGNVSRPMDFEETRQVKLLIWQAYQALEPFADLGKSVELSSQQIPPKQVPPRPVLPPDRRAKQNTPENQPETSQDKSAP